MRRTYPTMQIRTPNLHMNRTAEDVFRELRRIPRGQDDAWLFCVNQDGTIDPATDDSWAPPGPGAMDPAFQPIFENGWTNIGDPYPALSLYRKNGHVFCRGGITGGTIGTVVCQFPSDWAPGKNVRVDVSTDVPGITATFEMAADGTLKCIG